MPGVQVTVRLAGALAERSGNRRVVTLEAGARVHDLLEALTPGDLPEGASASVAVVAGGTIVSSAHVLVDGDRLDVLVPVAGG